MDVSENNGTPKSSMDYIIGISIINHPFWGTPIFGNTHMVDFFRSLRKVLGGSAVLSHGWAAPWIFRCMRSARRSARFDLTKSIGRLGKMRDF